MTNEWNVSSSSTQVVSVQEGNRRSHEFPQTTLLKDAVKSVAQTLGLGSVIVKADGAEITQEEGDNALSQYSTIEILPKVAGAIDNS